MGRVCGKRDVYQRLYNCAYYRIVMANSTKTFKHRLDIYWQDQEIIYDFRAQLQGTGSRSNIFRFD